MNRANGPWNLATAALLLAAAWSGAGCEGDTDEDNSGAESYFRSAPYVSDPRDQPGVAGLQLEPAQAVADVAGQTLVFTARGGYGAYHWSLSNPGNGQIRSQGADQAIYTCTQIGRNDVIVQDDEGHYAAARITPAAETLVVSPTAITLSGGALYVSLAASGGTPPYSWVAGNPSLGTVSFAAGSSHVAAYTAVSGAYGQNVISVVDAEGRTASAVITQQP